MRTDKLLLATMFCVVTCYGATAQNDMTGPTSNGNSTAMPPGHRVLMRNDNEGPYIPKCVTDPVKGVSEFSWFAVPSDKDLLDYISESCIGGAADAVNALTDMVEEVALLSTDIKALMADKKGAGINGVSTVAAKHKETLGSSMEKAYKKTKSLYTSMGELAAGPELFAAKCMFGGLTEYAKASTAGKMMEELKQVKDATEKYAKAKKAVNERLVVLDKLTQGINLTSSEMTLISNWTDVTSSLQTVAKGVNVLLSFVTDPNKFRSYESQAESELATAESLIGSLISDCQIRACDEHIKEGISAGQKALTASRRLAAQRHKEEDKWAQRINDYVYKHPLAAGRGWQYLDGDDPSLIPIRSEWEPWAKAHNERIEAEKEEENIKATLLKLGGLCTKMQPIANTLNDRISKYVQIYANGMKAAEACETKNAEGMLTQLKNLENSSCGSFFPTDNGRKRSEDLEKKMNEVRNSHKCEVETKWDGTYADTYSTITVSGKSINFQFQVGDSKGSGTWAIEKMEGNSVAGKWTSSYSDATKTGTRSGTVTASISGDTISGEYIEDTPIWSWKAGYGPHNVTSSMYKGKHWPFSLKRK